MKQKEREREGERERERERERKRKKQKTKGNREKKTRIRIERKRDKEQKYVQRLHDKNQHYTNMTYVITSFRAKIKNTAASLHTNKNDINVMYSENLINLNIYMATLDTKLVGEYAIYSVSY